MEKIKRFCRENARILLALGAVLAFCAVLPVMFAATAVPTGSWGLSFRTEGQPPVGNATAGALRQYDAVYVGDTQGDADAAAKAGIPFIFTEYGFGSVKDAAARIASLPELPAAVEKIFTEQ